MVTDNQMSDLKV